MNLSREQRRYLINTPNALDKIISSEVAKQLAAITYSSTTLLCCCMAIELHDKQGWGKKRINELFEYAIKQVECVNQGYVKREELFQECIRIGVDLK